MTFADCAIVGVGGVSTWDRGDGAGDGSNFVVDAEKLGIRGDFRQVAGPRALVPYRAGLWYFHGGVSLQELIVPAISLKTVSPERFEVKAPQGTLRYKRGTIRITTQLPVFELTVEAGDLFSKDATVQFSVEAHDRKGKVVGTAKLGGAVDPASGLVIVSMGETVQVTLKMDAGFRGPFTVKVLDPLTFRILTKVSLETDYME